MQRPISKADTHLLSRIEELRRGGRAREALVLCREALPSLKGSDAAQTHMAAGMLAKELSHIAEAAEHYQAAVRLEPTSFGAHYNLGNALLRLGQHTRAVESFRHALSLEPYFNAAHKNLSRALFLSGDLEGAVHASRQALLIGPPSAELHRNLGTALRETGDHEGAATCFREALAVKPNWPRALQSLANLQMEQGDSAGAKITCEAWIAQRPADTEALGLLSLALEDLGDREGAARLLDFDGLVKVYQVTEPPPGYGSVADFNAALSERALNHRTLRVPSQKDPRYHGAGLRLTEEFCAVREGPEADLRTLVLRMLGQYMREVFAQRPEHPFVRNAPERIQLSAWAAVLESGGSLLPHVHYRSHCSSVYYAKVPAEIGSSGSTAGWFEFGVTPGRYPRATSGETRTIEPKEGMLIVFPSYFYHRTVPFEASGPRISIAFDATGVS